MAPEAPPEYTAPDHVATVGPRHGSTCAVVVTYGDRSTLCSQVVEALLQEGVGKIVLVNNGSVAVSRAALECLARRHGRRLDLLTLEENTGSAGGFHAGLTHARRDCAFEFVWLLDDDNVPFPGALDQLHSRRLLLRRSGHDHRLALLSIRHRHSALTAIARGTSPSIIFPHSSFLNFDVGMFPLKILERGSRGLQQRAMKIDAVELPFGPYGGLLLSTRVLDEIGYPDERFFVYVDDTEFTHRLTKVGGHIVLVPASQVQDIDSPCDEPSRGRNGLTRMLLAESDFRVFYSVRNQVFFESQIWVRSHLRYRLNKWIFLTFARVASACLGCRERLALIRQAVRDGEDGRLGRTFIGRES